MSHLKAEFVRDIPVDTTMTRKLWRYGDLYFVTSHSCHGLGPRTVPFLSNDRGQVVDGYLGLKGERYAPHGDPVQPPAHDEVAAAVAGHGFVDPFGKPPVDLSIASPS